MCHFVLVFLSPFSIAITSPWEERVNLSAFRTFVRFVLVWICRFHLPLGVWEGLRFVIVALPGLFSYLFLCKGFMNSEVKKWPAPGIKHVIYWQGIILLYYNNFIILSVYISFKTFWYKRSHLMVFEVLTLRQFDQDICPWVPSIIFSWSEVMKHISCSTQLGMYCIC